MTDVRDDGRATTKPTFEEVFEITGAVFARAHCIVSIHKHREDEAHCRGYTTGPLAEHARRIADAHAAAARLFEELLAEFEKEKTAP